MVVAGIGWIIKVNLDANATNLKYVQLSIDILNSEVQDTPANQSIRKFAVDILEMHSPVNISAETKEALVTNRLSVPIACAPPDSMQLPEVTAQAVGPEGTIVEAPPSAQPPVTLGLRTQSLALTRDAMYRACEAYANGAISFDDYVRLVKASEASMLAILLSEQLLRAMP